MVRVGMQSEPQTKRNGDKEIITTIGDPVARQAHSKDKLNPKLITTTGSIPATISQKDLNQVIMTVFSRSVACKANYVTDDNAGGALRLEEGTY